MSEKAITGKLIGDKVVIKFDKELLLGLFEDYHSEYNKIKNKKKFLEAVAVAIVQQIEEDEEFLENVVDIVVNSDNDFIKEIEEEE